MIKMTYFPTSIIQNIIFYNNFKRIASIFCIFILFCAQTSAQEWIDVTGDEDGLRMQGKFTVWFDESNSLSQHDARQAYLNGEFSSLQSAGSTGLKKGAVWSHFSLRNTSERAITLDLEYVDHQLIRLSAYAKVVNSVEFRKIADLALDRPFSERPVPHNRFVFATHLQAGQTAEYLVKFSSDDKGFVFPNLRIWAPNKLIQMQTKEGMLAAFLFGGLLLISVIAFIVGMITKESFFFADSADSFFKIISWATILGYTHQFVITEHFHWSYMSITGAISLFFGHLFARIFLQTRKHMPLLDKVLLVMMGNLVFLLVCALMKLTALAVMSITFAMLLFPLVALMGIRRYLQGSKEAGVFALAWSFLIAGFVIQALRDLGFVEHNLLNYYWPFIAVYTEMIVVMVAMGLRLRLLRRQKIAAEQKYMTQLEDSKTELEEMVKQRTMQLEQQKSAAEREARTDALTGTRNRRSFFSEAGKLLERTKLENITLSVLMFDIDNFKTINDTYGHSVGDEALRCFSEAISKRIRETDIFGRIGGEEFSLLLCGSKEHALQTAERLRQDISQLRIDTGKGQLQFTTSIGVAHLKNENMIEDLLNQADNALYQAKAAGRNQVIESISSTD